MRRTATTRRTDSSGRESGFTLVELLAVVVIIGVLAAIAIPLYTNAQSAAKDHAAKSDLVAAKTAVLAYASDRGGWSRISSSGAVNAASTRTSGAGGFGDYGWAGTAAVDSSETAGGSETAFCIRRTSDAGTVFYVTQSAAPTSTRPAGCVAP